MVRAAGPQHIATGMVEDLITDRARRVVGVVSGDGRAWRAGAVVLTTGTFLRARFTWVRSAGPRVGAAILPQWVSRAGSMPSGSPWAD